MFTNLPISERLRRQLHFVVEIDKLKQVRRRTRIASGERFENSAEHSWHLAMMILVLAEHAAEPLDAAHATRLVLVHDIVEIDAGDTYAYDVEGNHHKLERERRAAERLFGLLPTDGAAEMMALWQEFEARETAEARFANAVDRLIPFLHNMLTGGEQWRHHGVTPAQIERRMAPVGEGSAALLQVVDELLARAVAENLLPSGPTREGQDP